MSWWPFRWSAWKVEVSWMQKRVKGNKRREHEQSHYHYFGNVPAIVVVVTG